MGKIVDSLKAVTNPWGLADNNFDTDGASGNSLLYDSPTVVAIHDHEPEQLDGDWGDANRASREKFHHPDDPGNLMRTPDNAYGWNSRDDYVGEGTASYFLQTDSAEIIVTRAETKHVLGIDRIDPNKAKVRLSALAYWVWSLGGLRKVYWVHDNQAPRMYNFTSWIGRFVEVRCHLKWCTRKKHKPKWWERFYFCGYMLAGKLSKKEDNNAYTLRWNMYRVAKLEGGWFVRKACKSWRKTMAKHWSHPGKLFGDHFQNDRFVREGVFPYDHPIIKALENSD